ncbi:uncharacterized protein K460DRAFT_101571 [Cucurbitaria berberidis CBS 394.84]|uniref:Uncharacterized protein n=1 Tax=Cucurbitaria berberidis CBS 394.84 TaxID=1168544 RepID=A0A9P4GGV6_9PLEO|nr:uncharacterized protein K460DRAFT_101571 [Cucurbitaria berberidis CBS 394.84]KAF1845006.1 hypothetical protein K460DRAFT_101571 [Cucurbitaria berberidis CBS 394.84]
MDDIARLDRAMSPAYDTISSIGTSSTAVFSTHDNSTVTKPTTTSTPYHSNVDKGKGKAKVPYASSLSVAYGSGSEAEAQRDTARGNALFAMGDWAAGASVPAEPLKGSARAKRRYRFDRQMKQKKPVVKIIHHGNPAGTPSEGVTVAGDNDQVVTVAHVNDTSEKRYLRRRVTHHNDDQLRLAEEGQICSAPMHISSRRPLSLTRISLLIGLTAMMIVTIALSSFGAHHTGKERIACTKGIVFGATVLMACFTVLAMMVARRAVQEALLAGLLETIIGFTLLVELDDFM